MPIVEMFSARIKNFNRKFTEDGEYSCPICRRGQIAAMPLMEAFACDTCNHIFDVNPANQTIKTADSVPPLMWRWNGRTWQGGSRQGMEIGKGTIIAAIAIVLFPTLLIGSSTFIYAPEPGSILWWFPYAWTVLTFLAHVGFVVAVAIDYYQVPVLVLLRASWRNLWRRSPV